MILASGSPRRRELLEELGIRPDIRPSSINETPLPDETPPELVKRLSLEKAMVCLKSLGEAERGTILAADKRGIRVACGQGESVRIIELQAPGKKRMRAADYLLGHPMRVED